MENPVIPGADVSGSRTLDSTTDWKLSQFLVINGMKSFFDINSCYKKNNEDDASFFDRYVLRLILLQALCETVDTGIRNTTKRIEVYDGITKNV